MENIVLTIHLILALLLVGVVLLQRSEGGGLGMGGGGGGGVMSGRSAATALAKLTWIFAAGFIATSITLTVLAAQKADSSSVIDQLGAPAPTPDAAPSPLGTDLLPPGPADAPLAPPAAPAPADTTAPAAPAPAAD
ncbi:MAG: preprotein translocase subunit SecG [Pseudomonadota bacterium]|jgi:preprotein translocase subunit SecG